MEASCSLNTIQVFSNRWLCLCRTSSERNLKCSWIPTRCPMMVPLHCAANRFPAMASVCPMAFLHQDQIGRRSNSWMSKAKKQLPDTLEKVKFSCQSWLRDDGLFYNRYLPDE